MASPGDRFKDVWTSAFANQLQALLDKTFRITGSGLAIVTPGKNGMQVNVPPQTAPLSTLQGILAGGSPPAVSDGTDIIDPYAWGAYSIRGAAFGLTAGTTNVTVLVNGVPISWLTAIPVTTVVTPVLLPDGPPDLTQNVPFGGQLSIQLSGSAGASGFLFSLYAPF